jgi:hypothetical protein
MTIVGIIGDVRQSRPTAPPNAEILMPYEQHLGASGTSLRVLVQDAGRARSAREFCPDHRRLSASSAC